MGSGGQGTTQNQGVGSNLVPSQGSGSSAGQGAGQLRSVSDLQAMGLNADGTPLNSGTSATPGTTLNSNPVTPNAATTAAIGAGTVPSSFGQPFNTTTTGGVAGSGATGLAPGQTGNVNLSPYESSTTPTPYSGLSPGLLSQNNGFTGGGSTQYGIPAGSQYVGSTPPSLDLSTPNWSGPALHQAIYQGNAYNVPSNVTQAMIGTGPGQMSPSQIPPWYSQPNNGINMPPGATLGANQLSDAQVAANRASALPSYLNVPVNGAYAPGGGPQAAPQATPGQGPGGPMTDAYWSGGQQGQPSPQSSPPGTVAPAAR